MRTAKPTGILPAQVYSTAELAAYLKIHRRTLEAWRRLRTHPELKWKRVGRRIRYLGADILQFLNPRPTSKAKRTRGVR